jgi:hypothetical protein
MIECRVSNYKIASSKREQFLSRALHGLRGHIEKLAIPVFEIVIRNISQKEFTFYVTPAFSNFKVARSEKKEPDTKVSEELPIFDAPSNLDADNLFEILKEVSDDSKFDLVNR